MSVKKALRAKYAAALAKLARKGPVWPGEAEALKAELKALAAELFAPAAKPAFA